MVLRSFGDNFTSENTVCTEKYKRVAFEDFFSVLSSVKTNFTEQMDWLIVDSWFLKLLNKLLTVGFVIERRVIFSGKRECDSDKQF